jgi:nucleotide-binding universal stress UspA family protein
MGVSTRILVAVDESEASSRVVSYVATVVGNREGFHIRLFHVLAALPPGLLEFAGSEKKETEEKMEAEEQAAQARWLEEMEKAAQPVFTKAQTILQGAGVPAQAVETQFSTSVNKQDVAADILEEARASRCGTIVVGRESFSRLRELFQQHVADELIRKSHGFTIWVVE